MQKSAMAFIYYIINYIFFNKINENLEFCKNKNSKCIQLYL